MPDVGWDDLSGAELRARLTQRGVRVDHAALMVSHREESYWAARIDEAMGVKR